VEDSVFDEEQDHQGARQFARFDQQPDQRKAGLQLII
jgi:hypothetical protein